MPVLSPTKNKKKPVRTYSGVRKSAARRKPLQLAPIGAFRELLEEPSSQRPELNPPKVAKRTTAIAKRTRRPLPDALAPTLRPSKRSKLAQNESTDARLRDVTELQMQDLVKHAKFRRSHDQQVSFPIPTLQTTERQGVGIITNGAEQTGLQQEVTEIIEDFSESSMRLANLHAFRTNTNQKGEAEECMTTSVILDSSNRVQSTQDISSAMLHSLNHLDDAVQTSRDRSLACSSMYASFESPSVPTLQRSPPVRSTGLLMSPTLDISLDKDMTSTAPPAGQLPHFQSVLSLGAASAIDKGDKSVSSNLPVPPDVSASTNPSPFEAKTRVNDMNRHHVEEPILSDSPVVSLDAFLTLAFMKAIETLNEKGEPLEIAVSAGTTQAVQKSSSMEDFGKLYMARPVLPKTIPFRTFALLLPTSPIKDFYVPREALSAGGIFGNGYLGPGRRGCWMLPLQGNAKETDKASPAVLLGLTGEMPEPVGTGSIIWTLARLCVLIQQIRKMGELGKWGVLDIHPAPAPSSSESACLPYFIKISCQASMALMLRSVLSDFACKLDEQGDEMNCLAEDVDRREGISGVRWLDENAGIRLHWWDEYERRVILVA